MIFRQALAWVIGVVHLGECIFFVARSLVMRRMSKYFDCATSFTQHEREHFFGQAFFCNLKKKRKQSEEKEEEKKQS